MRLGDWALMTVVALSWSGGWIASKVGVTDAPPIALAAVRFLIAGVCLLGLAALTRARIPWSRWPGLLALGASGIFAYNALVFVGLVFAPATDGGLIVPTFTPVLAAVLAAPFAGEPFTREGVLGLMVSMAGVALVVIGGAVLAGGDPLRLQGDLLILGGALSWAIYTVIGKAVLRHGSPLGVTAAATFLGGVMLVPAAIVEGRVRSVGSWPLDAWLAIGYLVVFSTIVGFVGFARSVSRLGAARAAMTSYLVPIGTLVLAAVLLQERVAPIQLVGGALTIAGMRIASLPEGDSFWLRRFVGI